MRRLHHLYPSLFAISLALASPLGAQNTPGPATVPDASTTGTSVEDLLVFRQIARLDLSTAQVRAITQQLSALDRAEQDYRARAKRAAAPVLLPMARVRTALSAGRAPDANDQAQVSAVLAALEPATTALVKQRAGVIRTIHDNLTARQLAALRGVAPPTDTTAAQPDENARAAQQQADADLQQRQQAMQALQAQHEQAQREMTETMDRLQKEMQATQEQMQKLEQGARQPAGAPQDGADPNQAIQLQVQEAQRQADLARRRADLVQQAAQKQVEMAQRGAEFAARQVQFVQQMGQFQAEMVRQMAQRGGAVDAGEAAAAADRTLEDYAIARLFLHPGVLAYLRARAAQ